MPSESVQFFRQNQIDNHSNGLLHDRGTSISRQNFDRLKSTKRLKSPKKSQELKKSMYDMKIENLFLNSEYLKHQSTNLSLGCCNGEIEENTRTNDNKIDVAPKQKHLTTTLNGSETGKNESAFHTEKERDSSYWCANMKKQKENCQETENFLEEILTEKRKSDRDLITLITEQMFLAERELQITRTHLVETISKLNEKDLEIIQLHEKIQNLQKLKTAETCKKDDYAEEINNCSNKTSEDYQRLILASLKLKKQVKDMEDFLNDYGLVWLGDRETNKKPDFDKIIKNFERLNSVASQPKIIQTTLGAKFELPREIPVTLYSNGVLLRNEDFREYNKVSTNLFLQDVEDGYFPSELQSEYPEGIPFEVVDKRNEIYNINSNVPVFKGQGNRLGSTFENKPMTVVFLKPEKDLKRHDRSPRCNSDFADRDLSKKFQKKSIKNTYNQKNLVPDFVSPYPEMNTSKQLEDRRQGSCKLLSLKIRFGKEKTSSFVIEVNENDRMIALEQSLQRKLCEMFHDEYLVDSESMISETDFEMHVYGQPPFRLSENLVKRIKDCGIVDNCVINVTEI